MTIWAGSNAYQYALPKTPLGTNSACLTVVPRSRTISGNLRRSSVSRSDNSMEYLLAMEV